MEKLVSGQNGWTNLKINPLEPTFYYIVQQNGAILKYDTVTKSSTIFLDLRSEVKALTDLKPKTMKFADERGLLNMTFTPDGNNFLIMLSEIADPTKYLEFYNQQIPEPNCMTVIYIYSLDQSAKKLLFAYPEPNENHKGSGMCWDTNGYFYVGTGDGGGAGDMHGKLIDPNDPTSFLGNALDLESIHGKLLRFTFDAQNYIAVDPKIDVIAWGLRNPWRLTIDEQNNIWIADVGQDKIELVKVLKAGDLNINFGWRAYEGNEVFNQTALDYIKMRGDTVQMPYITYGRDQGFAIVGAAKYQDTLVVADYSGHIMYVIGEDKQLKTLYKFNKPFMIYSMDLLSERVATFCIYNTEANLSYVYSFDIALIKDSVSTSQPSQNNSSPSIQTNVLSPRNNSIQLSQSVNNLTAVDNNSLNDISQSSQTIDLSPQTTMDDEPKSELDQADIDGIVERCIVAAEQTVSDSRHGKTTKMHIALIKRGESEATIYHSMADAWQGSYDIAKRKAFTAMAFSSNENAMTTRQFGKLTLPGQPLWNIGNSNPVGGVIEFAGGLPLYKNGKLIGGLGISGDSVDNDEIVAKAGAVGFEIPSALL